MKIKSLSAIFSFLLLLNLISCNDDLNTVGGSIQPPADTISVITDTVSLKARTVSMRDSVYARTVYGVLGQYEDDLFGTVKSDYLCQFMFPEEAKFSNTFKKVDSVFFVIDYLKYQGDSLAPMGLSVYAVDKPLVEDYYTNTDPSEYTDMSKVLASRAYTILGSDKISSSSWQRQIKADLGIPFGQSIYDGWKNGTIKDDKSFNDFFPGMYVTTTSGSGSIIDVLYTSIDIYYTHSYKDTLNITRDTTALFSLSVTSEVIQLNHIKSKNPEELFIEGTGASYLKTPAGVYTEVVFPISQIEENMVKKNMTTINSAQFSLKGYTEKEDEGGSFLKQPETLLLIPKDSIDSFFKGRKLPYHTVAGSSGYVTKGEFYAHMASRSKTNNVYAFGNISSVITEYKKKGVDEVVFAVLPIQTEYSTDLVTVYHYMLPSGAILRNDPKNMRLDLVYSKF